MMLDEKALRRPEFVPGSPVVLADGQRWELRRPIVRFVPADNANGFETRLKLDDDGTFARQLAAMEAAETGLASVVAQLAIGRTLLVANYDLTDSQVGDLLQFGYDDSDPAGVAIRDAVMDVVWGNGPKPSAAGDD